MRLRNFASWLGKTGLARSVWDVSAIYDDPESFAHLEADLAPNSLFALRACTCPGEEILAIDWHHAWYRFDPHAFPATSDLYNWQVPIEHSLVFAKQIAWLRDPWPKGESP